MPTNDYDFDTNNQDDIIFNGDTESHSLDEFVEQLDLEYDVINNVEDKLDKTDKVGDKNVY
jgi:hypothetical protein